MSFWPPRADIFNPRVICVTCSYITLDFLVSASYLLLCQEDSDKSRGVIYVRIVSKQQKWTFFSCFGHRTDGDQR